MTTPKGAPAVVVAVANSILCTVGLWLMEVAFPAEGWVVKLLAVAAFLPAAGAALVRAAWPQAGVSITKVVWASWFGLVGAYGFLVAMFWAFDPSERVLGPLFLGAGFSALLVGGIAGTNPGVGRGEGANHRAA